jgi:hypothetical protein
MFWESREVFMYLRKTYSFLGVKSSGAQQPMYFQKLTGAHNLRFMIFNITRHHIASKQIYLTKLVVLRLFKDSLLPVLTLLISSFCFPAACVFIESQDKQL